MFHIRCLLINNLWRICPDIIKRGYTYICLTPKYRTRLNNKDIFFNDDEELCNYRYNQIKKDIKLPKRGNLKYIIDIEDEFLERADSIINEYSIHPDIFDAALLSEDEEEFMSNFEELEFNDNTGRVQGFYKDHWNDFNLYNLIDDMSNSFEEFLKYTDFNLTAEIKGENRNISIYCLLCYIKENYKMKLFYLKGLGSYFAQVKPF